MEINSNGILYPGFVPGQTLKSSDLNNLVNYFSGEEEDTRVFLIGRGIFYGLEIDYNSIEKSITVSAGAGLSSNGELFALEKGCIFKKARKSIVTIAGNTVDAQVLTKEDDGASIVIKDDSIVIMQIQTEEEPNNDCLQRYDRAGTTTKSQIQVAVIPAATFTDIIIKGWGNKNKPDEMKELLVPFIHRFGNKDVKQVPEEKQAISFDDFTSWQKVKDNFNSVCEEGAIQIGGVYQTVYDTYAAQLGYPVNPNAFRDLPKKLTDKLKEVYRSNGYLLPYFYDYLKDLVNACIEFLDTTIDAPEFSYPDKNSFRDYISLGKVIIPDSGDKYRMELYRLPFSYADIETIDKPRMLMERMKRLADVNTFFINDQQLNEQQPCITPSAGLGFPLSARPIPFYLSNKDKLKEVWNYGSSQRKRLGSIAGMLDSEDRKILLRDMDAFSFFKIKGHAGFPLDMAKKEIENLRRDLHLPFDIRVLYLGDGKMEGELIAEFKGCFSDLKLQLENVLTNLACDDSCGPNILKLIFSGWNGNNDEYARFEMIGDFFDKNKFPPEEQKWLERALETCRGLCHERQPSCCVSYLRLFYDLYLEYKRRKEEILDGIFFHRFAKKHPGLEHNAGVYKGGTLFLICAMDVKTDDRIGKIFGFIQNSKNISETTKLELFQNITALTVVADFCLPYICSSKCPSIRAEFYQTAPEADFIETERKPIMDGENITGQTITIKNCSKNADSFRLTTFSSTGDVIEANDVTGIEISFNLLLKDDTHFLVQLDAKRGNLTSSKQRGFDISQEAQPVDTIALFGKRAEGYRTALDEIRSDKSLSKTEKFTQAEVFLGLKRKNIDKDFTGLIDTLQARFDSLADIRKQQVVQLARLATSLYLDKQILNAGDVVPATDNEPIKRAANFIRSNKIKTEELLPDWDADPITTENNKAVIDAFNLMLG